MNMAKHRNNKDTSSTWHLYISNSQSLDLYQRLATKMTMRTSSHKKWPWSTLNIPERNLVSKSITLVLYQRRVAIENISNPRNNKQLWGTWHKIKKNSDFKITKPRVCITGYHWKWPYLPLAIIIDLEAVYTFQRDIWFQNLNPLSYARVMNDSLIEYFIWLVTLKQNKYPNSMKMTLTPQIWILLFKIDLKHFILSVLMKFRIKT